MRRRRSSLSPSVTASHRRKLDWLANRIGVQKQEDWYGVKGSEAKKNGGRTLLQFHGNSLFKTLQTVYPEFLWNQLLFVHKPPNFWKNPKNYTDKKKKATTKNQRQMFDWIAEELGIQTKEDWHSVDELDLMNYGAGSVLHRHRGLLPSVLRTAYPEFEWDSMMFDCSKEKKMKEDRDLLDCIAEKLGVQKQQDWNSVTNEDISLCGGNSLLQSYHSIAEALQVLYSEFEWIHLHRKRVPENFWKKKQNQKELLDYIADQLGIETHEEWYSVTRLQLNKNGGTPLLRMYGNSLLKTLQSVYPQFEWDPKLVLWKSSSEERDLMNSIAEQLKIDTQERWYSVTWSQMKRIGAISLLWKYDSSLFKALSSIYPEFQWNSLLRKQNVQRNFFKSTTNRRKLMDFIAEQLGIQQFHDWNSISLEAVNYVGGSLLLKLYRYSLNSALRSIYPEFDPHVTHHVEVNKQREILDSVAHHLGINTQEDWTGVTWKDMKEAEGNSVLEPIGNSLFKSLQSAYPEYQWNSAEFKQTAWLLLKDKSQQRELADWIAHRVGIETQQDWYSISSVEFKQNGGSPLLLHYGDSLLKALRGVYPEFHWNPLSRLQPNLKKMTQEKQRAWLDSIAQQWNIENQEDWYSMIENSMDIVSSRARKMVRLLKNAYSEFSWPMVQNENAPKLMLAKTWHEGIDPRGFWMSEKFDGSRALWDGRFISRQGFIWRAPSELMESLFKLKELLPGWFTENFPSNMTLDGELWIGRGRYDDVQALVRMHKASEDLWQNVVFKVFDVPSLKDASFEERISAIEEYLSSHSVPFIELVQHERCEGLDHLTEMLREVENQGGEGLILRQPYSMYEVGRSNTFLKVKSFMDAEARVIAHRPAKESSHKGIRLGSLLCEMSDGRTFVIGSGFDDKTRKNPPSIHSIITYRYVANKSGLPKFAAYKGTRMDASVS